MLQVARTMYKIAQERGYSEDICRQYFAVGILHDIGYEFGDNHSHPEIGADILSEIGVNENIIHAIREHGNPDFHESDIAEVLNTADMTTKGDGTPVTFSERLDDITARYGKESIVYQEAARIVERLSK